MEEFKDIPGYEGLYQVSNLGNVKSLGNGKSNNSKEKILKPRKRKGGHSSVCLCYNSREKHLSISRLVAQSFLGLDINNLKICVCHRKEILNEKGLLYNGVDNLFLGTHLDNMQDMVKKGRSPKSFIGKFGKLNPTSKAIGQYSIDGNFIKEWESIKMAGRFYGISDSNIGSCCRGIYKQSSGFIWKYV